MLSALLSAESVSLSLEDCLQALDAAHRGHLGAFVSGFVSVSASDCPPAKESGAWADCKLATMSRERQQHETPPNIWLNATVSSRTIWKGNECIVATIEGRIRRSAIALALRFTHEQQRKPH